MHGNIVIVIVLFVLSGMGIGLYFLMKHIVTVIITRSETAKELENGGFMPGDDMDFSNAGPPPGAKSNMGTEADGDGDGDGDVSTWANDANESGTSEEPANREPPEFEAEYMAALHAESTAMGFTEEQHNDAMSVAKQAADQAWYHVQAVQEEQQNSLEGQALDAETIAMLEEFRQGLFAETGKQHYWMHLVNMLVGPMTEAYHGALQKAMDSNMQTRSLWENYHARVIVMRQDVQEQQQPQQQQADGGRQSVSGDGVATRSSIRPIQPSGSAH
ncbi:Mitochondrial import inner membrane translocase subunit tim23 [Ascosphaera pollenicola]|nr:Mitochondrial import inner membrane translocase subunit tim23 [Ascosphaera pollenicola]